MPERKGDEPKTTYSPAFNAFDQICRRVEEGGSSRIEVLVRVDENCFGMGGHNEWRRSAYSPNLFLTNSEMTGSSNEQTETSESNDNLSKPPQYRDCNGGHNARLPSYRHH